MTDTRLYYSTAANASSAVPPGLHQYTEKTVPVDADEIPLADSTLGWSYRRLSWANVKAALGTWYDTATRTMTNKTITAPTITTPKINYINDMSGAVALQFVASALELDELEAASDAVDDKDAKIGANYFAMLNGATGVAPKLLVTGAEAAVPLHFQTKGTGGYSFRVGSGGGSEIGAISVNATDPAGAQGRWSITNAPLSAANPIITLAAHATGSGKVSASLNLTTEAFGTVQANGVPVVTGSPASNSSAALSLWTGTKAQYDAIATKSATTIYVVTGATAVTGDITVDEGAQTADTAEPVATKSATTTTKKK